MLSSITRFPGGVGNQLPSAALADLKVPSTLVYNMFQSDFNLFNAADWTVGGTAAGVPALNVTSDGGVVDLPTTATNPSETSMSFGAPNLTVTPDIAKDLIVAARVKLDDVALGGFLFGLSGGGAASPLGSAPVNGIYFRKLTGTPTGQLVLRIASVDVLAITLPDVAAATWYDLAIVYTAADGIMRGFVNGAAVRFATNPATLGSSPLGLVFSVRNSSAAIRTLNIDNYLVAKGR